MDDEHNCDGQGCEHSKFAWELAGLILERMDGRPIPEAIDVIGQVSAILQATVYAKMKESNVELTMLDSWREWRDGLVLDMEEDMTRKKGSADGPG